MTLRAYDPRWPELSARRRDTSAGALSAGVLRPEHVDPRLGDVLLPDPDPDAEPEYVPAPAAAAYVLHIESQTGTSTTFRCSRRPTWTCTSSGRLPEIERVPLFRDRLRSPAGDRDRYAI